MMLLGRYPFIILGVVGAIAVLAMAYWSGMQHEGTKRDLQTAKEYIEGAKDAQDAKTDIPSDDSGRIEWLRDFAN